jgi:hypothetical protein
LTSRFRRISRHDRYLRRHLIELAAVYRRAVEQMAPQLHAEPQVFRSAK